MDDNNVVETTENNPTINYEEELKKTLEVGFEPITLGKRILRTETAGLTFMSILMYHLEG